MELILVALFFLVLTVAAWLAPKETSVEDHATEVDRGELR